jgi:protein O-GlcNAc transferase
LAAGWDDLPGAKLRGSERWFCQPPALIALYPHPARFMIAHTAQRCDLALRLAGIRRKSGDDAGVDGGNMSKSKRRRVSHQPKKTKPSQSSEIANTLHKALAFHQQGQLVQAEGLYRIILKQAPKHFDAKHLLGVIEFQRNNFETAVQLIGQALKLNSGHAGAHLNIGCALLELNRHAEALASFDRTLAIQPGYAKALNNRGAALLLLNRHDEALASCDRALAIKPDDPKTLCNRGNALLLLKRHEEALANCARALAIEPGFADALSVRGHTFRELGCHEEAGEEFARLLSLNPDYDYVRGNLLYSELHCCDWLEYSSKVTLIVNEVVAGRRAIAPLLFLSVSESPSEQLQCAKTYNKYKYTVPGHAIWKGERYRHDRIRVAYLSADFYNHATAYLMAALFEAHDKSRVETTAFSFGPDIKDEMRTRLENSFDRFVDVRDKSDRATALLLKELEIDIAVDLKGYTQGCRTGIFGWRAAPIQVNYLGYPGTMGVDYMDYVLADRFVIPEDQHSFYTEKVVYLPDTYQVNDSGRLISENAPKRAEAGLPEAGFVFCSFNNNYKIRPAVFDVWMRLLHRVEGSVLWLLEDNAAAVRNLRRNAEKRGVAPDRLVFAPRIKQEDHLARHRLAGFFLDTVPFNAHTTASDALWAGLPVVTCLGSSSFAGRVAGSLLNAVGLPELITDNLENYEALAVKLAQDRQLLATLKVKLAQNRQIFPLFDTDRFRRHIESAYQTMWERHQRGEPPTSFAVARESR